MKGIMISIEGLDGSGKTTQWERLSRWLEEQGYPLLRAREPGGTPLGEEIRELLLRPGRRLGSWSEALLYAAARAALVEEVLLPALAKGRLVVCDRFIDSSLAYQGYGRELGLESILELNRLGTGGLLPDLTLLLDVGAQEGPARARSKAGGPDRLEGEETEFYHRVRNGYLEAARRWPERIRLIPPGGVEDTWCQVVALVKDFLGQGEGKSCPGIE